MTDSQASLTPAISVIIPHLNQPEHLSRCLTSLKNQTEIDCPVEIIVVDNGSKVMPTDLCNHFANVRLDQASEPGPGPARNRGIEISSGDILAFIDADCLADPNWLKAIHATFENDQTIQVVGGDVRIAYKNADRLTMLEAYESIYAYRQKMYIEQKNFSGTGNLAMRRPVHQDVGKFAGIAIAEDRDWGQRATRKGYKIRYLAEMIVFHPARTSLADLYKKWDRHISHDFEEQAQGVSGRIRWLALTLAMGLSPGAEIFRIARSPRVRHLRDRVLAAVCLIRIRLYRAAKMSGFLFIGQSSQGSAAWNRK